MFPPLPENIKRERIRSVEIGTDELDEVDEIFDVAEPAYVLVYRSKQLVTPGARSSSSSQQSNPSTGGPSTTTIRLVSCIKAEVEDRFERRIFGRNEEFASVMTCLIDSMGREHSRRLEVPGCCVFERPPSVEAARGVIQRRRTLVRHFTPILDATPGMHLLYERPLFKIRCQPPGAGNTSAQGQGSESTGSGMGPGVENKNAVSTNQSSIRGGMAIGSGFESGILDDQSPMSVSRSPKSDGMGFGNGFGSGLVDDRRQVAPNRNPMGIEGAMEDRHDVPMSRSPTASGMGASGVPRVGMMVPRKTTFDQDEMMNVQNAVSPHSTQSPMKKVIDRMQGTEDRQVSRDMKQQQQHEDGSSSRSSGSSKDPPRGGGMGMMETWSPRNPAYGVPPSRTRGDGGWKPTATQPAMFSNTSAGADNWKNEVHKKQQQFDDYQPQSPDVARDENAEFESHSPVKTPIALQPQLKKLGSMPSTHTPRGGTNLIQTPISMAGGPDEGSNHQPKFTMEVDPRETVGSLKQKIHKSRGYPPGVQRLVFNGEVLSDKMRLADCNVTEESTLVLWLLLENGKAVRIG